MGGGLISDPPGSRAIPMPRAGDVIAGKYAIVRVLGEGGMGIVYEAMHQRLRQRVAIKMLLPAMLEHQVIVSRFDREARAAAQLRGRHIARVSDVDATPEGVPYMVMEFLQGHDLQAEIERRGKLPVDEAVDYVLQACAAMVEAHQLGIVHRDLKPSNLFLELESSTAPRGLRNDRIVKVLDFGISKVAPHAEAAEGKLTSADTMLGTAMYMSPEQVRQSDSVDARADIWALGVILYEVLAGRVPWLGGPTQVAAAIVSEDPPDLRSLCAVPSDLSLVIHKTLERDPNQRFADVKELAMALGPFAPLGSLGRSFADNLLAITTGSHPRVSISSSPNMPLQSLPPNEDASGERAQIARSAPGVNDQPTTTGSEGTSASRGRAALVGVLVAFVIGVITIGGVALFVRPRMPRAIGIAPTTIVSSSPTIASASTALLPIVPPPLVETPSAPPPAITSAKPQPPSSKPAVVKPTSSAKPSTSATSPPEGKPLFL